ncbi:hypothetical protein ILYODFUR_024301, partial [Ilyodon furcidens]
GGGKATTYLAFSVFVEDFLKKFLNSPLPRVRERWQSRKTQRGKAEATRELQYPAAHGPNSKARLTVFSTAAHSGSAQPRTSSQRRHVGQRRPMGGGVVLATGDGALMVIKLSSLCHLLQKVVGFSVKNLCFIEAVRKKPKLVCYICDT